MYDVVIVGGSISGLLCAREISKRNFSVLVLEEDFEIGTPEHCSGLVSSKGLNDLGIIPSQKTFEYNVRSAKIFSPNGNNITINSKKQNVLEVSRRELDKQVAFQAQKNGAKIQVNTLVQGFDPDGVKTKDEKIKCRIIVDARGVSSLIQKNNEGFLNSAQYEVYANWIDKDNVEVYFDQEKYPEFFSWIIPTNNGKAKVGVAGKSINAAKTLEEFLQNKGEHSVIRKIFAPIWIDGPIKNFVVDNVVTIGDAAGQTKPTTAGGIYTAGFGGILAGKAISRYLKTNHQEELMQYQQSWEEKFGDEFEKQLLVRKLLNRMDNKAVDKILLSVNQETIDNISQSDDFDFHTSSILKILGFKGSIKTAQAFIGQEIRNILRKIN